jgi:hypothetical protein
VIDPRSPFASFGAPEPIKHKEMHVCYCGACHYVWKAPAPPSTCVNCKGNDDDLVESLKQYELNVPLT